MQQLRCCKSCTRLRPEVKRPHFQPRGPAHQQASTARFRCTRRRTRFNICHTGKRISGYSTMPYGHRSCTRYMRGTSATICTIFWLWACTLSLFLQMPSINCGWCAISGTNTATLMATSTALFVEPKLIKWLDTALVQKAMDQTDDWRRRQMRKTEKQIDH